MVGGFELWSENIKQIRAILPQENLDFQNLGSTILGHSGRNFVELQTHLLEFLKVTIKVMLLQVHWWTDFY